MRPKKAKELITPVAEQLNMSSKMVEDIVNFYWREVWTALTNAQDIKVHVTNLGDFNIKHWNLDKEIENLDRMINASQFKGTQGYAAGMKMTDKQNLLRGLKLMVHDENQRKEFIYEHKKIVKDENKEIQFSGTMEA